MARLWRSWSWLGNVTEFHEENVMTVFNFTTSGVNFRPFTQPIQHLLRKINDVANTVMVKLKLVTHGFQNPIFTALRSVSVGNLFRSFGNSSRNFPYESFPELLRKLLIMFFQEFLQRYPRKMLQVFYQGLFREFLQRSLEKLQQEF